MTYLELVEKLRKRTGSGGGVLTDVTALTGSLARLADYVTEAWLEIQTSRRDWAFRQNSFVEDLTAGTDTYDLSEVALVGATFRSLQLGVVTLETLTDPNTRYRVAILTNDYFSDLYDIRTAGTGRPLHCTIKPNGHIQFSALLDVNYRIRGKYQTAAQRFGGNDEVPTGLPDELHDVIFWLALAKWAEYEEAPAEHKHAMASYSSLYTVLANDFTPRITAQAAPIA